MSAKPRSLKPGEEAPFVWGSHASQDRALKLAGTSGVAVYFALCRLHSECPPAFKDAFFASEENIGYYAGLSGRRCRPILEKLTTGKLIGKTVVGGRNARKYTLYSTTQTGQNVRPDETSARTITSTYLSDIKEVPSGIQPEEGTSTSVPVGVGLSDPTPPVRGEVQDAETEFRNRDHSF